MCNKYLAYTKKKRASCSGLYVPSDGLSCQGLKTCNKPRSCLRPDGPGRFIVSFQSSKEVRDLQKACLYHKCRLYKCGVSSPWCLSSSRCSSPFHLRHPKSVPLSTSYGIATQSTAIELLTAIENFRTSVPAGTRQIDIQESLHKVQHAESLVTMVLLRPTK